MAQNITAFPSDLSGRLSQIVTALQTLNTAARDAAQGPTQLTAALTGLGVKINQVMDTLNGIVFPSFAASIEEGRERRNAAFAGGNLTGVLDGAVLSGLSRAAETLHLSSTDLTTAFKTFATLPGLSTSQRIDLSARAQQAAQVVDGTSQQDWALALRDMGSAFQIDTSDADALREMGDKLVNFMLANGITDPKAALRQMQTESNAMGQQGQQGMAAFDSMLARATLAARSGGDGALALSGLATSLTASLPSAIKSALDQGNSSVETIVRDAINAGQNPAQAVIDALTKAGKGTLVTADLRATSAQYSQAIAPYHAAPDGGPNPALLTLDKASAAYQQSFEGRLNALLNDWSNAVSNLGFTLEKFGLLFFPIGEALASFTNWIATAGDGIVLAFIALGAITLAATRLGAALYRAAAGARAKGLKTSVRDIAFGDPTKVTSAKDAVLQLKPLLADIRSNTATIAATSKQATSKQATSKQGDNGKNGLATLPELARKANGKLNTLDRSLGHILAAIQDQARGREKQHNYFAFLRRMDASLKTIVNRLGTSRDRKTKTPGSGLMHGLDKINGSVRALLALHRSPEYGKTERKISLLTKINSKLALMLRNLGGKEGSAGNPTAFTSALRAAVEQLQHFSGWLDRIARQPSPSAGGLGGGGHGNGGNRHGGTGDNGGGGNGGGGGGGPRPASPTRRRLLRGLGATVAVATVLGATSAFAAEPAYDEDKAIAEANARHAAAQSSGEVYGPTAPPEFYPDPPSEPPEIEPIYPTEPPEFYPDAPSAAQDNDAAYRLPDQAEPETEPKAAPAIEALPDPGADFGSFADGLMNMAFSVGMMVGLVQDLTMPFTMLGGLFRRSGAAEVSRDMGKVEKSLGGVEKRVKRFPSLLGGIKAAFGGLGGAMKGGLLSGMTSLVKGFGVVKNVLGSAFVRLISSAGGALLRIAMSVLPPLIGALGSLNLALLANPIVLIIAGIVAAVAGIAYLIYSYWDEIIAWLGGLGEALMGPWKAIQEFFGGMWDGIKEGWQAFFDWAGAIIDSIGGVVGKIAGYFWGPDDEKDADEKDADEQDDGEQDAETDKKPREPVPAVNTTPAPTPTLTSVSDARHGGGPPPQAVVNAQITVNAAPGMDAAEVARLVKAELKRWTDRETAASRATLAAPTA